MIWWFQGSNNWKRSFSESAKMAIKASPHNCEISNKNTFGVVHRLPLQLSDHVIPTPSFVRLQEVVDNQATRVLKGTNRALGLENLFVYYKSSFQSCFENNSQRDLICVENSCDSLTQSDAKIQAITILSLAFSRASDSLLVFTLIPHRLLVITVK